MRATGQDEKKEKDEANVFFSVSKCMCQEIDVQFVEPVSCHVEHFTWPGSRGRGLMTQECCHLENPHVPIEII